jgi:hypothetical protein
VYVLGLLLYCGFLTPASNSRTLSNTGSSKGLIVVSSRSTFLNKVAKEVSKAAAEMVRPAMAQGE